MRFTIFTLFLALVLVAQTSAFKCSWAERMKVKKCLMEKGECKDVCKACVEDKCVGEVGKAKAECAMANCQQDCKCKRKCLNACINKE